MIGRLELDPDAGADPRGRTAPRGLLELFVGNPWWETIHYGRHQSSLNGHQAVADSDGLVRVVMCAGSRRRQLARHRGYSNGAMILRCVRTETAPIPTYAVSCVRRRASALPADTAGSPPTNARRYIDARRLAVHERFAPMTFSADELEDGARDATGLDDFGSPYYREGLERTVDALNNEADSQRHGPGHSARDHQQRADPAAQGRGHLRTAPGDRRRDGGRSGLRHRAAPHRDDRVEPARRRRPSVPLAADVGIQAPTPPPEAATQHSDPRIAQAEEGLAMLNDMFPLMKTMHNSEATAATECQDLMGMSFRTYHFDGVVRVPSYLDWLMDCDMRGTYAFHRRVLKLLQWHCPPTLWHLKTRCTCSRSTRCRGVPEREIPLEPSRSRQGAGFGVQPHPLRSQLEQRPRRS